ncbi:MAG: type I DNA topoisomerase [Lachnospiraceae bacterium]|nr:type I DNA topoisomerase [Lachnospiraceae bacterium]
MSKNLVIVESPTKEKTIKKFLGSSYSVKSSMGHVRDLPKSELGIDIENNFEPKYITIRGKGELLSVLRKETKAADKIYLATDPDREGEAISWHLMHALKLEDKNVSRITFNEITKDAVKKSIKEARDIDMNLVNAQQARRVLDRLVGYSLSSLLWEKVKKGLSGGRVQSVALRIICDREDEIANFVPVEYWSITALLENSHNKEFEAKYFGKGDEKTELNSEEETNAVLNSIKDKDFIVDEIKKSVRKRNPFAPFSTSTFQQEASRYLSMTAQKSMAVAQQLYEGVNIKGEGTVGLVSYIRTDSVRISDEAYEGVKKFIISKYGEEFLNPKRPVYKTKGRTQDAHEAIRPTLVSRTPDSIKESLTKEQYKVYKMIWERFVASQMSPASYDTVAVKINCGEHIFKSNGSRLIFKGFLEVYRMAEDDEESLNLPELKEGEALKLKGISPNQHFTQPLPRYTDASLIKTLEEYGVGRPSTYAPTLTTIMARHYVIRDKKILYPTELGEVVNDIMKNNFSNIVDIGFTVDMENNLDKIEEGSCEWHKLIADFYPSFKEDLEKAKANIYKVKLKDEVTDIICEKCGRNMVIKYGKYGKFLACPGFPECHNAKPLFESAGVKCPKCGGEVLIKKTKKGRMYYGCENNPECDFMTWNKPTGEKCEKCGSPLVYKTKKEDVIICSNDKCRFTKQKNNSSL